MVTHSSKFTTIEVDELKKRVNQTWLKSSETMTESEFKAEMLELATVYQQYKPRLVFVDQLEMFFPIVPELQEWIGNNVARHLVECGSEKVAFVASKDFFAAISVEQTMSESISGKLTTRFYRNQQEAEAWLNE